MVGSYNNRGTYINGDLIYVNGKRLPSPPNQSKGRNITVIGNHVFVNGYEYKNGKWKRTLRALWHSLF